MKVISIIFLAPIFVSFLFYGQTEMTTKKVSIDDNIIYSIYFYDSQNGCALCNNRVCFITNDKGINWSITDSSKIKKFDGKILWSADICLHVLHTLNSGKKWSDYFGEQKDHFMQAYMRDENTKYKIGIEFLQKVFNKIWAVENVTNLMNKYDSPQKFTEYYSNENEGWKLEWYLKNFKVKM